MNARDSKGGPGCPEYHHLSRRQFLKRTAGTALLTSLLPGALPRVALADGGPARDVLVSVYMRGGADGLSLCAPYGDDAYYTLRPTLAIPRPDSSSTDRAVNLDGFFGLSQAMKSLLPAYQAGHLLAVHATGSIDGTRSHFDAQRFMEVGQANNPTLYTGWLARHLASATPLKSNAPLRALAVSSGLPLTLNGAPNALPISDPTYFNLEGDWQTRDTRRADLNQIYAATVEPMRSAALNTDATIQLLDQVGVGNYQPAGGAVYPANSYFAFGLKCAAALIKADVGVEAIHLDIGGWDTHNNQGAVGGWMATLMQEFADSIAAFHADIYAGNGKDVTLVALSEFGRNVAENASKGTDHGHGNALFALGKKIKGGRVLRNWPGLDVAQQYEQQDLQVTIDHRDILAEIVQNRLGNANLASVFPQYTPTFRGVTLP